MGNFALNMNTIIVLVTVIISLLVMNNWDKKSNLAFLPFVINRDKSQLFRFISHGFIHANFIHLLFNMVTLFSFGSLCENIIFGGNKLLYLGFYLTALVVSSLYDYFTKKNDSTYISLGASGAVNAVIFATLLASHPWKIAVLLFGVLPLPTLVFAVLYLGYSFYASKQDNDNIGHEAHISGAIFGFVFAAIYQPLMFLSFKNNIFNFTNPFN